MTGRDFTGKPIQCKAAICWTPNAPIVVETVTVAPPKYKEVRIKMVSAGICASDLSFQVGDNHPNMFPLILGHEANGIVESIGEGVTAFKPGDFVIPLWNPECGDCNNCRNPQSNICEKTQVFINAVLLDGTTRFSKDGKSIFSFSGLGTFSEYSVIDEICLLKVDPKLDLTKLAPFGCCVPTGFGAAVNSAKVHKGSTVAIWGLGAVGLCVVLGCKKAGAKTIIGVDTNPDKFVIGKKFGCTDFINPLNGIKSDVELIREIAKGGADYTFVAVGSKIAAESAMEACHNGYGKTLIIGLIHGQGKLSIDPFDLIMGKSLLGSYCGGYRSKDGIPKLIESYKNNELPEADLLITSKIKLAQINDGFEQLRKGKQLRTVIIF